MSTSDNCRIYVQPFRQDALQKPLIASLKQSAPSCCA